MDAITIGLILVVLYIWSKKSAGESTSVSTDTPIRSSGTTNIFQNSGGVPVETASGSAVINGGVQISTLPAPVIIPTGSLNGGTTQGLQDYATPTGIPGVYSPSQAQINQALNLIALGDPSVAKAFLFGTDVALTPDQANSLSNALRSAGYL